MLLYLFLLLSHIIGPTAGDTISPQREEVSGTEGEDVTLTCSYQTSYSNVDLYWYKHHSDLQAPQFILWKGGKSRSGVEYIPDKRFGSQTSDTSTELTIRELTLADTALYYCAGRSLGGPALTFGKPIKLTVAPRDTSERIPSLFVLSPLLPPGYPPRSADQLGPDVCLATDFRPSTARMVLNLGAGPTALTTAGAALSTASGGYYYAGVSNSTVHSCQLLGAAASNTADDLCEDLYPEQARLNYYLLVLNSVRILLTKAVAFNTLLTARAPLSLQLQ